MADSGDWSLEEGDGRSRIWFSMSRAFPATETLGDEEKGRRERKEAIRGWHCRHTDGRLFASAFIEKELIAAACRAAAIDDPRRDGNSRNPSQSKIEETRRTERISTGKYSRGRRSRRRSQSRGRTRGGKRNTGSFSKSWHLSTFSLTHFPRPTLTFILLPEHPGWAGFYRPLFISSISSSRPSPSPSRA